MTFVRIGLYWSLAFLLTLALPSRAADTPTAKPLDGLWKGPLQMPGGQLEVVFRLVKLTSGEYFATLDVPLQKVSHLAVTVSTRADTVLLASDEANSRYTGRLSTDGNQLQGTWRQPGFTVPLVLTRSAPPADAAKPVLTPPYRQDEVTFSNLPASLRLAGTLMVPTGTGPFPAVVLLSDAGPQDRNSTVGDFALLKQLSDYLTRRGIAVLRFDDRGTGQSTGSPHATTAELVSDAQAALNYLRTRPEIDLAHLGLIGHGEGGNVALLAAAQPLPPAFVVCLAPYGLPGSDITLQQQEAALRSQKVPSDQLTAAIKRQQSMFEIIRQTSDNGQAQAIVANMLKQNTATLDEAAAQARAAEMVSPAYRYYLSFNPLEALPKVTCPVFLLYGAADATLNADNNLGPLTKALKGDKNVTVKKLPGVNHLFQADPAQWAIVSGQLRPILSFVAAEEIRTWLMEQSHK